ncbi:16S rRNA (adenine(1518)-N(6)/adenine(1519)-N(6))-dimethyltransferase RsmA [Thiofilum flexile]|uniref:16S rRNA (adenine(1518)-N(6)/adenine(1519)-N(6))- dimethyltransferase RsmA n=1 Tax=Thiofilum flexile TaxID=125627 RepID=UPI00036CC64E|nr:16S rRNA (adenine(1518)-N(6)/adenine(1519)-N(6))-dimethyltransferase RsmA [Thiofilum flexile]
MSHYQNRTKKRFGQHFLQDTSIINSLVRAIYPKSEQQIIEIGPGGGALTFPLLDYVDHLEVVELDRDVIAWWQSQTDLNDKLTIHAQDALTIDFKALARHDKIRVVGNLPYNISTPLIFHLLEQVDVIEDMHFMLQKEVVDRLVAVAGNKDHGRMAVMVQYWCETEFLFDVPPSAFSPPPKVDSAVVRLTPRRVIKDPVQNTQKLSELVALAFAQRRKTLRNNLKSIISDAGFEALGIDPSRRAETLEVSDFVRLTNYWLEQTALSKATG